MTAAAATDDRTCDVRIPRIVVALSHPTMRRYVCDVIEQGCRCWLATTPPGPEELAATVAALSPDIVVLDSEAFAAPSSSNLGLLSPHMLVIGPRPDGAYRDVALRAGARGWVSRDRVATDLLPEIRRALEDGG